MELSKMTAMEAKLDAIMNRMDEQERKMHTAHEIGVVKRELLRGSADVPTEELFMMLRRLSIWGNQGVITSNQILICQHIIIQH